MITTLLSAAEVWLSPLFRQRPSEYDQVVVTPLHPGVEVTANQLTEENEDFAARSRYHQSAPGGALPDLPKPQ